MKTFALALGGGGARGLAHIVVVEALDEMGVKPLAIAGTSIGALVGGAYAAALRGKDIRHHVLAFAHNRAETMRRLVPGARRQACRFVRRRLRSRRADRRREILRAVPARNDSRGFLRSANSAHGDGDRSASPPGGAADIGAAAGGSRRLDRHTRPAAAGRPRRSRSHRWRRHQSAAVRPAARARRLHRRRRRVERAARRAQRHSAPLGMHVHHAQHHGQRHCRRQARTRQPPTS